MMDLLGFFYQNDFWNCIYIFGEWEFICYVMGYYGMFSFKVKLKIFFVYGWQYVMDYGGGKIFFNIVKQFRVKFMLIWYNLVVCRGEIEDDVYIILVDLVGRMMQIVNEKEEWIVMVEKFMKMLIMNVVFGVGSEFVIDIVLGVDWIVILVILIGLK